MCALRDPAHWLLALCLAVDSWRISDTPSSRSKELLRASIAGTTRTSQKGFVHSCISVVSILFFVEQDPYPYPLSSPPQRSIDDQHVLSLSPHCPMPATCVNASALCAAVRFGWAPRKLNKCVQCSAMLCAVFWIGVVLWCVV